MMASQSNDIYTHRLPNGDTKLCVIIYDKISQQRIGAMTPMTLFGSEEQLNGGRFHSYDPSVRDISITTTVSMSGVNRALINMVEWVADNARSKWSFFVTGDPLDLTIDVVFYFDDPEDAMLFRLHIN